MNWRRVLRAAALVVFLSGCMRPPFRTAPYCRDASFAYSPTLCSGKINYWLNVIEFDENGRRFDRPCGQLASAVDTIKELAAKPTPLLLVIFVHGWRHSARPGDDHFDGFRKVIADTAAAHPGLSVMGVYLGWRGSVGLKPEKLNVFSFWNRRNAADRMADSLQVADTLLHLGFTARKEYAEKAPRSRQPDGTTMPTSQPLIVVVGHSFGGRIVERAVMPFLLTGIRERSEINYLRPFNLVVLLNPASSALATKDLIDALRGADHYTVPFVINVTASNDRSTGLWYPLAQTLSGSSGPFEEFGDPADSTFKGGERYLSIHTAGHMQQFQSHQATVAPTDSRATDNCPYCFSVMEKGSRSDYLVQESGADPKPWNWGRDDLSKYPTPYWVILADKHVVKDHGDVFNLKLQALLVRILHNKWGATPTRIGSPSGPSQSSISAGRKRMR
jgi:hypothetical protein